MPAKSKPTTDELLAAGTIRQRKTAALFLGITDRQLGNWTGEAWFPEGGRTADGWNIPAILQARDSAGRKGSAESAEARALQTEKARQELLQQTMKTERMQREAAEAEGNILDRAEFEIAIAELVTVARDRLRSLPKDLARLAGTAKLRDKLITEGARIVDKILGDLARQSETPQE